MKNKLVINTAILCVFMSMMDIKLIVLFNVAYIWEKVYLQSRTLVLMISN